MLTQERASEICGKAEAFNSFNNEHRQFMTPEEIKQVERLSPRFAFCDHVQQIAGKLFFGKNGTTHKPWTV